MTSELKDCPFCGRGAWIIRPSDTKRYRPQCSKCGADLGEFDREADAIAAWNRRTLLRRLSHRAGDVLHPREPMPDGWCTLAVGNGTGRLFVHGPYEAIKICQAALLTPSAPVAGSGEEKV